MASVKERTDSGTLAVLMQHFFKVNFGQTSLPKTVADTEIYDQLDVQPGITRFFQGAYNPARSNWPNGNNFIAAESEHFVVLGIRAYQGFDAETPVPIDETDWQPGISDPILKNGTWNATINGLRVLRDVPMTVFDTNFLDTNASGATNDNRGIWWLWEPLVILGQTGIQLNLSLNAGVTPTEFSRVRFVLVGTSFIGN